MLSVVVQTESPRPPARPRRDIGIDKRPSGPHAGGLRSITIDATAEYLGHTGFRGKPFDFAFVTCAGPWAEARAQWPRSTLDGEDDEGDAFEYYLLATRLSTPAAMELSTNSCAPDAGLLGDHAHLLNSL
jgi:hypothetical protein